MKKFTQKLIAILLCVAMIGAWLPMGAHAEEPAQNSGGAYEIDSADKLNWFAAHVNAGNTDADAVLTADIDMGQQAWTPIGSASAAYAGTFDGDGHTISGLYCGDTAAGYVGLVGCLAEGGAVKNVTVTASYISGKNNVGGIVGYSYGGSVTGCHYSGTISTTSGGAGGIVGYARTGTLIENCSASGTVSGGGSNTGGIAGYAAGTIRGCSNEATVTCTTSGVGGIVGWSYNGAVEDCANTGDVSSTTTGTTATAGGIAGNVTGGTVSGCTNSGAVTGTAVVGGIAGQLSQGAAVTGCGNSGTVTGTSTTKSQVGGVVGNAYGLSGSTVSVTKCYNTGNVSGGYQFTGGIAGQANYATIDNTYNTGNIIGGSTYVGGVVGGFGSNHNTLSNSYSIGSVTGSKSFVGAVIGSKQGTGTITNCYYLPGTAADVKGTAQNGTGNGAQGSATADTAGATASAAEAQFASGEVCYLLNGAVSEGDLVWYQTIGTDASPKFQGGTVYYDAATGTYSNEADEQPAGVAYNTTTDTAYDTLKGALDAVQAGQTVILLADCTANTVLVIPGAILDLNGHELTASYVVGFDTADIVDNIGTGRLVTAVDNVVLDEGNAMIPVYDGEGYCFTKAGFGIKQDTTHTGSGIKIDAVANPVNMTVVDLLKDGGADNNVQIVILLSWDTEQGTGSQRFVFTDAVVGQVYSSNDGSSWSGYSKMFSMVVTGFESISNLSARIAIVSDTNVEYVSSSVVNIT